jgi:DNA-binding transcriptional LysR family regulator
MQELDWNDLRYILCLSRTGRIAGAARKLGVNETTVARRIARVEGLLGVRLFERDAGVLRPTDSGQIVIRRAERIELDVDAVKDGVTSADSVAVGKVRVKAVPLVRRRCTPGRSWVNLTAASLARSPWRKSNATSSPAGKGWGVRRRTREN